MRCNHEGCGQEMKRKDVSLFNSSQAMINIIIFIKLDCDDRFMFRMNQQLLLSFPV